MKLGRQLETSDCRWTADVTAAIFPCAQVTVATDDAIVVVPITNVTGKGTKKIASGPRK